VGAVSHGFRHAARIMLDRRTATKLIRFHPDELRQITAHARRFGQTPARFMRETALGASPRPRHHAAAVPVLCELARIGRSLEQLARFAVASQDATLAAQTSAALERHQALVRQIVQRYRQKGRASSRARLPSCAPWLPRPRPPSRSKAPDAQGPAPRPRGRAGGVAR
jgi:hypothetical protein